MGVLSIVRMVRTYPAGMPPTWHRPCGLALSSVRGERLGCLQHFGARLESLPWTARASEIDNAGKVTQRNTDLFRPPFLMRSLLTVSRLTDAFLCVSSGEIGNRNVQAHRYHFLSASDDVVPFVECR